MPTAACEEEVPVRRGRGRPPRPIPQWLMDALERTAADRTPAVLSRNAGDAPLTADGLHELRLMLRAAATRLGGRLHVRVTETHVQFWMEPPDTGTAAGTAAEEGSGDDGAGD